LSEFTIGTSPGNLSPTGQVDWNRLIQYATDKSGDRKPYRIGSKSISKACGVLTVRFSGGFLNSNITGQSGAIELPVIQIRRGKRVLLPDTGLATCDKNDSRTEVFGSCPGKWATAITAKSNRMRTIEITIERTFLETEGTFKKVNVVLHP
jgi:hypothetical protein